MPQCIWFFLPVGFRKFCNLLFLTNLLHPCIPFSTFTCGFHFCTYSVSWFDLLRVNWLNCFLKETISSHYIVDCALTLLLFYSVESWIVCVLTTMAVVVRQSYPGSRGNFCNARMGMGCRDDWRAIVHNAVLQKLRVAFTITLSIHHGQNHSVPGREHVGDV